MELKFGLKKYNVVSDFTPFDDDRDVAKVERKGKFFTVSKYVNHFNGNLKDLQTLKRFGIRMPKLIKIDSKNHMILEEFIEGKNMLETLVEEDISDEVIGQLFDIYRFCRFSKCEILYYPDYFVIGPRGLTYIGRKIFKQNANDNLENYGFQFWIPSQAANERCHKVLDKWIDKERLLTQAEVNKQTTLNAIKHW